MAGQFSLPNPFVHTELYKPVSAPKNKIEQPSSYKIYNHYWNKLDRELRVYRQVQKSL